MTPATPASLRCLLLAAALALGSACSSDETTSLSPLAQEGKQIYQNVCIACHSGNPAADGALGPAVAGASKALLAARVIRGEYPPGYEPKRPGSNAMPKFPYLEAQIPALHAYLAEVPQQQAASTGS